MNINAHLDCLLRDKSADFGKIQDNFVGSPLKKHQCKD